MLRACVVACGMLLAGRSAADMVLSAPNAHVAPGAPLALDLTILNSADEPYTFELPQPLHVRFETATTVSILELEAQHGGSYTLAPHGFTTVQLTGTVPATAQGPARLKPTGLATNEVVLHVQPASVDLGAIQGHPVAQAEPNNDKSRAQAQSWRTALVDKPPPLAVSVYEPMYFLLGGDGGFNAKFQLSFRYQLFDGRGPLASRLNWIDDLYVSFSQTSLWDLSELSKPFTDSSYRPRLFYANYRLGTFLDGRLRFGLESGVGHESNGKEGDESRSYNMLYARPSLMFGDADGLRFYIAPLIHNYIQEDENPDLDHYRGYVDLLLGAGSKGGLDFWAVLRKGTRSDYGSVEVNASFPLSKLSGGDLTGWLMLQYFVGYGESLLDYRRKLDSQARVGIAVAL